MAEMYHVHVPPGQSHGIREAVDKLDLNELDEQGVQAGLFFLGDSLVMRLSGHADALRKLEQTKTGAAFLRVLDERAWFRKAATALESLAAQEGRA